MEKLSDRIKDFPTEQFIDWLCLSCVDVRASHSDELAQEDINKIREAVTVRLATLEDKLRIKQNHIRLRDSYIEELEERAESAEEKLAERDALAAKGMELCREAAHVYEKYNVTQMPDMDLVDCQTIQEFSDLAGGSITTDAYANHLRAEGVEMFAKHFNCADISDDILEFAANLRKENGNG